MSSCLYLDTVAIGKTVKMAWDESYETKAVDGQYDQMNNNQTTNARKTKDWMTNDQNNRTVVACTTLNYDTFLSKARDLSFAWIFL